jgi:hypothetical protein
MHKKLYLIAKVIVLAFALYSTYYMWNIPKLTQRHKLILIVVVASIVYVGMKKFTYLPFLSYTVLPSVFLNLQPMTPSGASVKKTIHLNEYQQKAKWIIYWAAMPKTSSTTPDVKVAYGNYSNMGVAKITGSTVDIMVQPPTDYTVDSCIHLEPHVHYRFVTDEFLSNVHTLYL